MNYMYQDKTNYRNGSGAPDPTPKPVYDEVDREGMRKLRMCINAMRGVARAMNITVISDIDLRDNSTGCVWRSREAKDRARNRGFC